MFTKPVPEVHQDLMDWHEVADLRSFTTLSDKGQAGLIDQIAALDAQRDALTAQIWQATAVLLDDTPVAEREFLAGELAAALNAHPSLGKTLVQTAEDVHQVPALLQAVRRGEIGERHVHTALKVLSRDVPAEVREAVALRVLNRIRTRIMHKGGSFPTPANLGRALRKQLLKHDPAGAKQREKQATDRRGMSVSALPDGQAVLSLYGPAAEVLAMADGIRAHALAGWDPADGRTREQREFDTGRSLLGGGHARPDGRPRGGEFQILMPVSVAEGGELEVCELVGYGPILPSTARELLADADSLRRVCVDAHTGQVLSVDDPVRITGADHEAAVADALARLRTDPITRRDLSTDAYRPSRRLVHLIRTRDRTCTFPGCTRPGRYCDIDHRDPWPHGRTDEANLHCLCRRHHRAKQVRWIVTREPDGSTTWTSKATGKKYFRPPPDW